MPEKQITYTQKFTVYRADGDYLGNVKLGALLRYAQQIATTHAEAVMCIRSFSRVNTSASSRRARSSSARSRSSCSLYGSYRSSCSKRHIVFSPC